MNKHKLLEGEALKKKAKELGVSMQGLGDSRGSIDEPELQRRVMEAQRSRREQKLWVVAVLSALIALVSAIAAWLAVLKA